MKKKTSIQGIWSWTAESTYCEFTCSTYHSVKLGQHMLHSSALFIYQVC